MAATKISELAELIFLKNTSNSVINICLPSLNNAFELFAFLVNIVSQALVLYCGETVDIAKVDASQIHEICKRLHFAGIHYRIDILPRPPPTINSGTYVMVQNDGAKLEDHAFHIVTDTQLYVSRFAVFRFNTGRCGASLC